MGHDVLSELRMEYGTAEHVGRMPADLPELFVDGWRENGHSRVVLAGDEIVATGSSCPNRVHPTRDLLAISVREPWRRQGIGTLLYRELREFHQVPFSAKAAPESVAHAFVTSLGGRAYQFCPGGRVDAADPRVRAWVGAHRLGPVERGAPPSVRRGDERAPVCAAGRRACAPVSAAGRRARNRPAA